MAPLTASIEIKRSPDDVFAYLADLGRHDEWQSSIQETEVQTEGPTRVGSRVREHRKPPHGPAMWATYEMTEFDPPRKASFRGIDGPVRVQGTVTVEPAGEGSRVTLTIDATGHGFGKVILPLVRKEMRKQVPLDQQQLKERLESGSP